MNAKELSQILENLSHELPVKPDWIAVVSVDGLYIAGTNFAPLSQGVVEKEDRVSALTSAHNTVAARVNKELGLGDSEFIVTSGEAGLYFILPLFDYFLLGIKFGKEIGYVDLANIVDKLFLAIEELSVWLRKYSP